MKNYLFCLHAWNHTSFQNRCALLAQTGHSTIYAHRAYAYVPKWVRFDLQRFLLIRKAA